MATVRYTVVDGEVIAEKRGGVRRCYVPDPLGSTVALLDNTQTQTDTFTYWPYGEVKTRTGTTTTPFQFVGTLGYYRDGSGRTYVRARTLRTDLTRWQTEDLSENGFGGAGKYGYASSAPVQFVDTTGYSPSKPPSFNPGLWNDPYNRTHNNCYSYACNFLATGPANSSWGLLPQPGHGVGNECDCRSVDAAIGKGGWLKPRRGAHCPPGTYTVIMFVRTVVGDCDFHFIRRDRNGRWSEKCGAGYVGSQFDDPYQHAKEIGCDVVCQVYCAPNRTPKHMPY
jgi:RHS repeat-associated protein